MKELLILASNYDYFPAWCFTCNVKWLSSCYHLEGFRKDQYEATVNAQIKCLEKL